MINSTNVAVVELDRLLELARTANAAEIFRNAADELKQRLEDAQRSIEALEDENEELRRGLKESEENVDYWRGNYTRAVKKYAEAVVDEDHEQMRPA